VAVTREVQITCSDYTLFFHITSVYFSQIETFLEQVLRRKQMCAYIPNIIECVILQVTNNAEKLFPF
jgi:hypothetical protein